MIHPTAIVHKNAKLGADVKVGPFCIIGENVVLGDRVELISNVVIDGKTEIGDDSMIYPFAVIGVISQDRKFQNDDETTGLFIGKRCKIREYATIHSGTPASNGTRIGDDCQFMVSSHIGHDCQIGNNVVLSNLAQLAGHVEVEDNAIVSPMTGVHQFVRIGRNAFIGGMSGVGTDVPPYTIYMGQPAIYRTINKTGLLRYGFSNEDIHAIHSVYSAYFSKDEDGSTAAERLKKVRKEISGNKYALDALDFIENRSTRGIGGASCGA